jgi:hypothetical protein
LYHGTDRRSIENQAVKGNVTVRDVSLYVADLDKAAGYAIYRSHQRKGDPVVVEFIHGTEKVIFGGYRPGKRVFEYSYVPPGEKLTVKAVYPVNPRPSFLSRIAKASLVFGRQMLPEICADNARCRTPFSLEFFGADC